MYVQNLRVRCCGGVEFFTRSAQSVRGSLSEKFLLVDGDRAISGSYRWVCTIVHAVYFTHVFKAALINNCYINNGSNDCVRWKVSLKETNQQMKITRLCSSSSLDGVFHCFSVQCFVFWPQFPVAAASCLQQIAIISPLYLPSTKQQTNKSTD